MVGGQITIVNQGDVPVFDMGDKSACSSCRTAWRSKLKVVRRRAELGARVLLVSVEVFLVRSNPVGGYVVLRSPQVDLARANQLMQPLFQLVLDERSKQEAYGSGQRFADLPFHQARAVENRSS
jgi:hypothetical protein